MLISTNLRNWGMGSEPGTMLECAAHAEDAGLDTIWNNDRLCAPVGMGLPEADSTRFLDCLMALSFVAARTDRIRLGTAVLNLPYRRPYQLVKQVASLQDLSAGRFRFGIGVGWYETEFEVLGVPYKKRGKLTDSALELYNDAFENDTVSINDAEIVALPRPSRPPVYVGGMSDAALKRAVDFGDGWMPAGMTPEEIDASKAKLLELAAEAGKPPPTIVAMKTLPLEDPPAAVAMAQAYAEAGCVEFVHAGGYPDATAYRKRVDLLANKIIPAVA
jgi:probable F420-dependent oxidoreductase